MLHKIKCNANYAFMEHDYLALLATGHGPSKPTFTEDTSSIPKQCFSNFFDSAAINPDTPRCITYKILGKFVNFTTYMIPWII